MIVVDTSTLIRFFTNDIPSKASQVRRLIDSTNTLFIPDVVFPELEYVLLGQSYNTSRSKIAKAFGYLASKKNIVVSPTVKSAIDMYTKTNFDMADCIIAASSKGHELFSFDKKLISEKQKMEKK